MTRRQLQYEDPATISRDRLRERLEKLAASQPPRTPTRPAPKPRPAPPRAAPKRASLNIKTTHSIDSNMYHPPAMTSRTGSNTSTIQRDTEAMMALEGPSYVRDSSDVHSVLYHPPVNLEDNVNEEKIQINRYRAAIESSFTPRGVRDFKRKMDDGILQIMSSSTDATESTMGNTSTFGASSDNMQGVTSTNTCETNTTNDPASSPTNKKRRQTALIFSSETDLSVHNLLADDLQERAEDDYFRVKQPFGYCSIVITAIQLLVLMLQLALCGVAPLDVNPMVGPYPDVFSEWGGKNAYLIIEKRQVFRLLTPAILHVGILHLMCNAYVQLETCAFFEREWGSARWVILYLLSEIGSVAVSCVINSDTISVGSSGAVMGLFGAKFAQLVTYHNFELVGTKNSEIRLEQLSGIMCSLSIIAVLSFVNYIDWSGHAGGFAAGFCCGIVALSGPIRSSASRFLWIVFGLVLLGLGFYYTFEALFTKTAADSDLANPCEYFRNLFAEDYQCECLWG